jgi:hypothetical protein
MVKKYDRFQSLKDGDMIPSNDSPTVRLPRRGDLSTGSSRSYPDRSGYQPEGTDQISWDDDSWAGRVELTALAPVTAAETAKAAAVERGQQAIAEDFLRDEAAIRWCHLDSTTSMTIDDPRIADRISDLDQPNFTNRGP